MVTLSNELFDELIFDLRLLLGNDSSVFEWYKHMPLAGTKWLASRTEEWLEAESQMWFIRTKRTTWLKSWAGT